MKPISAETVEKTFTRMWEMAEPDAMRLSYTMQKEQPLLVAYLAAVDEGILNQEERELLFYLGTVLWQVMAAGGEPLPKLTEQQLLDCEKRNMRIGESLKHADNVKFAGVVKQILKECRQYEVLRYTIAALMDESGEDNTIRDENLGIIMLDLKTVLDCLDQ